MSKRPIIGIVGPCGIDEEDRNPAASMYFRDILSEYCSNEMFDKNDFEIHWLTEKHITTDDFQAQFSCVDLEPTWTLSNFIFSIPGKLKKINSDIIYIHHEPFLFSNTIFHSLAFLIMLVVTKLLNWNARLILILATVYDGKLPSDMARQSPLPEKITDLGFKVLLRILPLMTDSIMVAKSSQKSILVNHYRAKESKVYEVLSYTINHPLIDKSEARKILGLDTDALIILNYGCLSYYKGLEKLLPAYFEHLDIKRDSLLLLAGGAHPRLSFNKKYSSYIKNLKSYAQDHESERKRALFTGFVPGELVSTYFGAADIAVMPYTSHIASSAVLFDGISYEKPILISKAIIEHALLDDSSIVFDTTTSEEIARKIELLVTNDEIRERNVEIVRAVKKERVISHTVNQMLTMFKREVN